MRDESDQEDEREQARRCADLSRWCPKLLRSQAPLFSITIAIRNSSLGHFSRADLGHFSRALKPGDARLPERLRTPELLPLGSRIRRRLHVDAASRDELCACLDHVLEAAGNPSLMTSELRVTLAEHALGNYRILMNMADELLAVAVERELPRLDDKLFLEVFQQPQRAKSSTPARKR